MKRVLDFITAVVGLLMLSPVLLLVAIVVRLYLGSPIIFSQQRPGLHAKPFHIYKFRSMSSAVDVNGRLLPDEKRLTQLGKFLRKYSLDELPQLFNVIKGDLSFVGPRPLLMEYLPLYSKEQSRRHDVRPGITGWAQVNGRNALSWEDKFKLDIWYVDHHSLYLDLKILGMTFLKVLKSEGVTQNNQVTTTKFSGNHKEENLVD